MSTSTSLMGLGMSAALANIVGAEYSTIAATGSTHADAAQCTTKFCVVTAGDGTKGVKMPDAQINEDIEIVNNSASNLKIYPYTITDTFIATGSPVVATIATYTTFRAKKATATTWVTQEIPSGV